MLFNKTTYVDFVSDYGKFIAVSYTTKFKIFGIVIYTIYKEVPTEQFIDDSINYDISEDGSTVTINLDDTPKASNVIGFKK